WNDRLPPGALSPQSLLARVASLLPGNDGDADDWTRLRALSQPEQIYHLADSDGTEAAGARALELSAKIDAFLEKDPAPDQRSEAVQTQRQLLMAAARVGAANADAAWKRAAERERARAGITEDERYRLDADSASFE